MSVTMVARCAVAALLVGALAGSESASGATARCRGVSVTVRHHGRRCLNRRILKAIPHIKEPGPHFVQAWGRADPAAPVIKRLRHTAKRRRRQALTLLARDRQAIARLQAFAADDPPPIRPVDLGDAPPGWTAHASEEAWLDNPKGQASGVTIQQDAHADSPPPLATRARMRVTTIKGFSWDCPDADGNARGTVTFRERKVITETDLRTGRVLSSNTVEYGYVGHFVAHVDDHALFVDYDLDVDAFSGNHHARFSFRHLQLDQPWNLSPGNESHIDWGGDTGQEHLQWDINGPTRTRAEFRELPLGEHVAELLFLQADMAHDAASRAVKEAFLYWYEFSDCVKVTYTPPGSRTLLRVPIGGSKTLTIAARSRLDNALVRGTGTITFDLGTVTPGTVALHDGQTAQVTLQARHGTNHPGLTLLLQALSKRGRIVGPLDVDAKPPSFAVTAYSSQVTSTTGQGTRTESMRLAGGVQPLTPYPPCPATGPCTFSVEGHTVLTVSGHVTGTAGPDCPSGSFDYPPQEFPYIGAVHVDVGPAGQTTLRDNLPSVGVGDTQVNYCGAYTFADASGADPTTSLTTASLLSGNPVTFSWSRSGMENGFGNVPISWTANASITLHAVAP